METGSQRLPDNQRDKLHERMQMYSVELVSWVNRICDRHEAGQRVSNREIMAARNTLGFIGEGLDKIEETSPQ